MAFYPNPSKFNGQELCYGKVISLEEAFLKIPNIPWNFKSNENPQNLEKKK